MLISGVYYAIRTSAILTSLNVGLCGTDRRFIFVFYIRKVFKTLRLYLLSQIMAKEYEYEIRVTSTFVKDSVQRHVSRVPTATMLESQIGNSVFVRSLHHRHILTP